MASYIRFKSSLVRLNCLDMNWPSRIKSFGPTTSLVRRISAKAARHMPLNS